MAIAIIDEFPILRNGLKFFINDNFDDVSIIESRSIVAFRDAYPDDNPDLIIIALSQNPVLGNLDVISMAKKWYDLKTVIIYDEKADFSMIPQYFRAGIHGYISKQSGLDELRNCIKQVLNGKRYMDLEIKLNSWLYLADKMSSENNVRLTTRQYEIAVYLSEGKKTSWIAQKLEKRPSTISTVKKNIFKRLSIDNIIALREMIQSNRVN